MIPSPLSPGRPGFTLIELLVVISIIALLIAILLPALGAARKSAQRSQSLSNCRQIATATVAFAADDKKNRFPPCLNGSGVERFFTLLGKEGPGNQLPPRYRPLNEYLVGSSNIPDNAEIDVAKAPLEQGAGVSLSSYDDFGSSYVANFRRQNDWIQGNGVLYGMTDGGQLAWSNPPSLAFVNSDGYVETPGIDLDRVPDSSEMVTVGETGAFIQGQSWGLPTTAPDRYHYNFGPDGPDMWHLSFLDGHAAITEVKPGTCWGDGFRFSWKDPPAGYVQPE